jgi:aminopeptidase
MESAPLPVNALSHIRDTITIALDHAPDRPALIVYDEHSRLSRLLGQAYRAILRNANAVNFDRSSPEAIMKMVDSLSPGDLVVLVQSASFRLSRFRIRIELFKRGLKVIEHPHLSRMREEEFQAYFDSLAYDPSYYRMVGPLLQERITRASRITISGETAKLIYDSGFLEPKLNIGHYEGMKNIGGQFPIGEVFTEPADLRSVNGSVTFFAFGDADFSVHFPDRPFTVFIERGLLVSSPDAPAAFRAVLDEIRRTEKTVSVRELGFGLNQAFSRVRRVTDIGSYERMCGIHLSLGAKHLQYVKPDFPRKRGFHVDVFVDAKRVEIDGFTVFRNGEYETGAMKKGSA